MHEGISHFTAVQQMEGRIAHSQDGRGAMIYDLHVHLAGTGSGSTGNYLSPVLRRRLSFRFLVRRLGLAPEALTRPDADWQIAQLIVNQLRASIVDRAVVLALDAAYRDDGARDDEHTLMVTDNDFVADLSAAHEKLLFGASIHPYRHDAVVELERLAARGACLVKWLPGAQNIQPDHPRCLRFYEALAHYRIPLLCHAGVEHTLKMFPNSLNDPRRLTPALERGVTVIAAHCGSRIFLHEKSYYRAWREMALRYERFYGDISAFGVITRIWLLKRILKSPALTAKLVFGSDYPTTAMPVSCIGPVSLRRALELRRMTNPFDQAVGIIKAVGTPDAVFARAGQLLPIPEGKDKSSRPGNGEAAPRAADAVYV
jgi:predicted TIM-barrel fold metal-dependent hydrolase